MPNTRPGSFKEGNTVIKVLKTEADYEAALEAVREIQKS